MQMFYYIFLLGILTLSPALVGAEEPPVTSEEKVSAMAEEYGLFEPSPYSYHFRQEDVEFWADQGLSEEKLHEQFDARKRIRSLAADMGYEVATTDGRQTPGVLSYWAERLLWEVDEGHIAHEFGELLKIREDSGTATAPLSEADALRKGSVIKEMAEKHGLFEENPYAWTFTEGDIIWYVYQGKSREQLEKEFAAKARVRNLARETGFELKDPSGRISSGELSYWADFLLDDTMSHEKMKRFFEKWADRDG